MILTAIFAAIAFAAGVIATVAYLKDDMGDPGPNHPARKADLMRQVRTTRQVAQMPPSHRCDADNPHACTTGIRAVEHYAAEHYKEVKR